MSAIENDSQTPPKDGAQSTWGIHVLYGRRIARLLYLQVPFFAFSNAQVASRTADAPDGYSSFYFTPGVQVRWPPDRRWSVFVTGGAGVARYVQSERLTSGAPNSGSRTSQQGLGFVDGGVDLRVNERLSVRTDVRGLMTRPDFLKDRLGISHYGTSTSLMLLLRF